MKKEGILGRGPFSIFCCFLVGVCSAGNANASFVFGDSLVDVGNNNYIVSLSKANYIPNGIDLLPTRQPTGRFTNGRTIADIIGKIYYLEFGHFPCSLMRMSCSDPL